jgi:TolA-binding protein
MDWLIIVLVVLAVVLAAALIWTAMKRKKDKVGRQRASELRSDAAATAATKQEQEARAREAEAEAERVRAQADKLDARAQEQRTSYDQTRAQQEDALREADRVDPDVDHRAPDYRPGTDDMPPRTGATQQNESRTGSHAQPTGPADPVPPGPETVMPPEHGHGHEHDQERRDQI